MSELSAGAASPSISHASDRKRLLWAGTTVFDVVLGGEHTGGSMALLDQVGHRGDATPVHIHRVDAEIFYILEGGITAWAGDARYDLDAGSAVYLPAGLPHAFAVSSEQVRLITVAAPAGFADFVRTAGVPVSGDVPASWEFDVGRIMSAAPMHDIDIVGPPPSLPA